MKKRKRPATVYATPVKPKIMKLRAMKFDKNFYSCKDLHELLGICRCLLAMYCAEGLVPHCRKLSNDWIISKSGAIFLWRWNQHREALGSLWKRTVRRAASKADPACIVRQQEYEQKHPNTEGEVQLDDVLEIRRRFKDGELLETIAADYGIDQSTVYYIGTGRSYPLPRRLNLPT